MQKMFNAIFNIILGLLKLVEMWAYERTVTDNAVVDGMSLFMNDLVGYRYRFLGGLIRLIVVKTREGGTRIVELTVFGSRLFKYSNIK